MRIGSLCSGYGGLELAVQQVIGGRVVWQSEYEPPTKENPRPSQAAAAVLSHRFPGVPNIGDMTAADWSALEPVDVLCGGTPCQDVSHAGKRAGMRAGTRSGLWSAMVDAIDVLRPPLVVWENVRGALSARADSGVEPCPLCVGDGTRPALRALGRVLGDLADSGYDARWCGLRASDVGAPHPRYRVFVAAEDTHRAAGDQWWLAASGQAEGGRAWADAGRRDRAPVADASSDGRHEGRPEPARQLGGPDVAVSRNAAADADSYGVRVEPVAEPGRGGETVARGCHAATADADDTGRGEQRRALAVSAKDGPAQHGGTPAQWGPYEPAIRRWEAVTRPAPDPREPGATGERLSPRFVEWMMGLPEGWVTGVPGITRNDQLKMLGNGVVPQQAAAAIRYLLEVK